LRPADLVGIVSERDLLQPKYVNNPDSRFYREEKKKKKKKPQKGGKKGKWEKL